MIHWLHTCMANCEWNRS